MPPQKLVMPSRRATPYSRVQATVQQQQEEALVEASSDTKIMAKLINSAGDVTVDSCFYNQSITPQELNKIVSQHLNSEDNPLEPTHFTFLISGSEVKESLGATLQGLLKDGAPVCESHIDIVYVPHTRFHVRTLSRCSSSIPGHTGAITIASFSPNGSALVTGSADNTVRFWDITTFTPLFKPCKGHLDNVFDVAWSPDGKKVASVCRKGLLIIWNPKDGSQIGKTIVAHREYIHRVVWEPFHLGPDCDRLVTASKDGTAKVWSVSARVPTFVLNHEKSVKCVKWGGTGLIYTGSQDLTVRVWRASDGVMCRILKGHAHWITQLALNTDYVLRTGPFEPSLEKMGLWDTTAKKEELVVRARQRYSAVHAQMEERLVSSSNDHTMYLWAPESSAKPIAKMFGHRDKVMDVKFSPNCAFIASASFDHTIRLWEGATGNYLATLKGHIQSVYRVAWSSDSRLLLSGSKDSTLKVWSLATKKIHKDLPGHADEIYTVDWSPCGVLGASGGHDKVLKIWRC